MSRIVTAQLGRAFCLVALSVSITTGAFAQGYLSNPQKLPAQNLQDLIQHAKANPGKLNVGVGAIVSQLFYEAIKAEAGVNAEVINFRGSQPTTAAPVVKRAGLRLD